MTTILNTLRDISVALFGGTIGAETYDGAIPVFFEWLTSAAVAPYFLIGVCVALFLMATRVVKSIFWGV